MRALGPEPKVCGVLERQGNQKLKKTRNLKLLSKSSVGVFHSKEWMKSGYALLASSRTLRATWTANKRKLLKLMSHNDLRQISLFDRDTQLLGPSMLLLGYAAEMFLKAGLAKTLHGCSEQLFQSLSSKEYGHNLQRLAQDIYFKLNKESSEDLVTLQRTIETEGRYPIEAEDINDHFFKYNSLRIKNASKLNYQRICRLVSQLAKHSHALGGTHTCRVSTESWQYDNDGYISYWWKEDLPPRITFRLSPELENEPDPIQTLREMIKSLPRLDSAWDRCDLYQEEVEVKVRLRKRQASK